MGDVAGRRRPWIVAGALVAGAFIAAGGPALAQRVHNTYGSPLDTIKNTHLTTSVPEAKDFVRATSPDKSKLDYTPLTGTAPDRPKPRDPKGVAALQAELESAGARNETRAKGMLPRKTATRQAKAGGARSVGTASADGGQATR